MTSSLLAQYQTIEQTSKHLVQAARDGRWDQVSELERQCRQQVRRARELATTAQLSPVEKASKQRLLLAILRHEAQVRSLAEPWMADLTHVLGVNAAIRH